MPLSLNDDEYNAVQAAAAPIHPLQRDIFLKALEVELKRHPVVGPGLVHRMAAQLQKTFGVVAHSETLLAPAQRARQAGALSGFVTPTVADLSFAGKMADGDLVRSPPIPA